MKRLRAWTALAGAVIAAAALAACSPSGESVTVINECDNEIQFIGSTIDNLPTASPLPDGFYPAPVDELEAQMIPAGSRAVFAFDSEPVITVVSMGVSEGSPNMVNAQVDTSAWNDASEGRRIVVPLSFCAGETDQLSVEIAAS